MRVTYTAGPGDVTVWEFDPDEVDYDDAERIEKRYGQNWDSFLVDVRSGSARARRLLLWHLLQLAHPSLRFDDVPRYKMGALQVEHSVAELRQARERVQMSNLPDEDKDGVLAVLDIEIDEAMAGGESGKVPDTEASTTSPG